MAARRRHVVFVPHRFLPYRGGVQTMFANAARALMTRGHRATVLTTVATTTGSLGWPGEGLLEEGPATEEGVPVVRLPIRHMGRIARCAAHRFKETFGDAGGPLREAVRRALLGPDLPTLEPALRELEPDLVVTAGLPYRHVFDLRRVARKLGVPYALMPCIHAHKPLDYQSGSALALYGQADALLPLTPFEEELLVSWGVARERIHLLPHGPDLPSAPDDTGADAAWRALRLPRGRPYLLYVGRLTPQKNLPLLLEAFGRISGEKPLIDLVLAGASTRWSEEELPAYVAHHRNRVHAVPDFAPEAKRGLLSGARALVNPSDEESLGIVFLEAWACGRPVIAADIGPIRTLVADGETGLLFEAGSAEDLARHMRALSQDEPTADAMGAAGRERTAGGWDQCADVLLSLCQ